MNEEPLMPKNVPHIQTLGCLASSYLHVLRR